MYNFEWVTLHNSFDVPKEIRTKVFMYEQGFNNEFDDTDARSFHLAVTCEDRPAACLRLFRGDNNIFIIGRIAVMPEYRGTGLGKKCVLEAEKMAARLGGKYSQLSAQCRAMDFYLKLGYSPFGQEYLDEHVPHINMRKDLSSSVTELRWFSPGSDITDALQVRKTVFTKEYGSVNDPDEFDSRSYNMVIYHEGIPACCGRIYLLCQDRAKLGKIAVLGQLRKSGMGSIVMHNLLFKAAELGVQHIELSALTTARGFYESMGLVACSDEYEMNGRIHINMTKEI